MKKVLSFLLALTLLLGLTPVLAAEPVTPTPPEWIDPEEYIVFPGDEVYEPENWAKIEALREEARNGAKLTTDDEDYNAVHWAEGSAGTCYETALLRLKYAENAGVDTKEGRHAFYSAGRAFSAAEEEYGKRDKDERYYRLIIEMYRAWTIYSGTYASDYREHLMPALAALGMTVDDFFAGQYMELCPPQRRADIRAELQRIDLFLDGTAVELDVYPEVKNQRTMVPVRAVGEAIGADVEWVQETQQVVMTRAGSTVTMTLNSTTADIDGKKVEMDVAPYATNGRTLLPARYVAEFFGQKVEWNGAKHQVFITEDKSAVGNSNMEEWALPMGAMLASPKLNTGSSPTRFGCYSRDTRYIKKVRDDRLSGGWSIESREDLINTVVSMTFYGHDATFREMAADVKLRTPEERAEISAASTAWPDYMWEYTEYVDKKWGEKGIMAWDLFRMSNLVQWGYTAGYVTYEEALALLEPAATILRENFSSWDEAYENYLDGYNWWARNNVLGQDIWQTERGQVYQKMREDKLTGPIFDDTLFTTGVIPLPEK